MIEVQLKDGGFIHFRNYGTDPVTGKDVYIADELLPEKFSMNDMMIGGDWKDMALRNNLDTYLLNNFPKEFILSLQKDEFGDIVSIPSVEELFSENDIEDIFKDRKIYKYDTHDINREMGEIYWLKNRLNSVDGMYCCCCSLGGCDIQVVTNQEGVRMRILI